MGANRGTRSSIGMFETSFAAGARGAVAQPPSPASPPSASEFFSKSRRSIDLPRFRAFYKLSPKCRGLAMKLFRDGPGNRPGLERNAFHRFRRQLLRARRYVIGLEQIGHNVGIDRGRQRAGMVQRHGGGDIVE